jgi:HAE1 family hydrophobic/amphiphilic exporter-1
MSKLFINRPIFASVISLVIVIAGLVAMSALPISRYPEIAPPTVTVTAVYPGADAETVAETVSTPLEQEINGVENMLFMSSVASSDGSVTITVTFEVGADLDMAQVLVQNRVAVAEPKLPEEVKRQGITVKKKSAEITLFISLFSPDSTYNDLYLSNYASLQLKDQIARVSGVGDVTIFGAGDYGMRVWIDPELLRARDLTTNDVLAAIREQNVQVAAGRINAPPSPTDGATEFVVNVKGRLTDPAEFEQIVIKSDDQGRIVKLTDVARVELGAKDYSQVSRFNLNPATVLAVYQLPGSNAIDVVNGVTDTMDRLSKNFPPGVVHDISYKSTDVILASIKEVVITLLVAIILVVLTVYVFLQSFRATLIPAATIPVSLIGTFAVMLALGFSINLLTLFGLVLAIGIVVDDAIVVVENCTRHLDESDMTPKEAALKCMEEVTTPVIATTLVLLAVFIPTAFLPGIQGQLFRQFALTIAIATGFSSINALTLAPALSAILLRPTPKKPALPFRIFNTLLGTTTNIYVSIVKRSIRLAILSCVAFAAIVATALWGFAQLPTGFVPQEDEGWAMISVQLPDGSAQHRTDNVLQRIEKIAQDTPGIANVIAITGYSIIDQAIASNAGTVFVIFEPWDARTDPLQSQGSIIASLNKAMRPIQEATAFSFPLPSLPGMGNNAGLPAQLEDRSGAGLRALSAASDQLIAATTSQSAIAAAMTTFRTNTPQLFVDIDREGVISRNVAMQDVFDTLGAALGSAYVNDITLAGRIFQVRVQADALFRATAEDITRLEVRSRDGAMVPLGAVAQIEDRVAPAVVTRYNVYPAAKIMFVTSPAVSMGAGMALVENTARETLPPGFEIEWTDIAYQAQQSGSPIAVFVLAIILVYLVLAAQYESWSLPMSVIFAIPSALLGATGALFLLQLDSNLYTQIGVVLLIGLSAKSSILIVEFARERRQQGDDPATAATTAAELRFRAILMTAFSFILGVLPLLLSSGAGAESRRAIGATVFGGMLVGTVISLLFVPVLYFVVQRTAERFSAKAPTQIDA